MKKLIKIRKVPVESLLEIIAHLYHNGVDFIDFDGEIGNEEDKLGLSFGRDYMDPDYADQYDTLFPLNKEEEESPIEVKKLKDDDLNQLI